MEYYIFIDESRYLEHDNFKYMVIGGIWVSINSVEEIKLNIKEIKNRFGIFSEMKWKKVSTYTLPFHNEILDYFFNHPDLNFRCVTVNKEKLVHKEYNSQYKDFYYKVCYQLLIKKIKKPFSYRIFLDYKDKYNREKILTLKRCLVVKLKDIEEEIIYDINTIRSENSIFIQLCDLLIGAVGYGRNKINTSNTKLELVNTILKKNNRRNFDYSSSLSEEKFNIFNMFDT